MCESGSRFRNRIGENGRRVFPVLQHLAFDRDDVGQHVAVRDDDALWARPVAPDVKMISAVSSRGRRWPWRSEWSCQSRSSSGQTFRSRVATRWRHVLADEHHARLDDRGDSREKIGRRTVVDGHCDDALEQAAPQRRNPFRTVLGPDHTASPLRRPALCRRAARARWRPGRRPVGVLPPTVAVVVCQEDTAGFGKVVEEVEQRLAAHAWSMIPAVPYTNLPPALVVGALYDSFLQAALRQFFARATFETEPMLSVSSDGRLAIEPTDDPSVMYVRWFGTRYGLRVSPRRPFTEHEIRLARSIGSVLAARYHAILNPKALVDRGELFRGADRRSLRRHVRRRTPVSARRRRDEGGPHRVCDRSASGGGALELRKPRDFDRRADPRRRHADPGAPEGGPGRRPVYSQALTAVKSFFRLVDGQRTLFLVGRDGKLLDIVDVQQWANTVCGASTELPAPVPPAHRARTGDAHGRSRLRRAEPVGRDQVVCRRRAGAGVPPRALAPARPQSQVRAVGRRGGSPAPGRAAVPDGARPGRRAAGRAVRGAARSRRAVLEAGGVDGPRRRASDG